MAPLLTTLATREITPLWAAWVNSLVSLGLCSLHSALDRSSDTSESAARALMGAGRVTAVACSYAVGLLSMFAAQSRLDPAAYSLIMRAYVVFGVLGDSLFGGRCLGMRSLTGLMLVVCGSVLLKGHAGLLNDGWGIAFGLLASALFALHHGLMVPWGGLSRNRNKAMRLANLLAMGMATSMILLEPQPTAGLDFRWQPLILVACAATCSTFLGTPLFLRSLANLGLGEAALWRSLTPLAVMAISQPFFPVEWTAKLMIGVLVLLAGLALFATSDRNAPTDERREEIEHERAAHPRLLQKHGRKGHSAKTIGQTAR